MEKLDIHSQPQVKEKFQQYPPEVRGKLELLREIILQTGSELPDIHSVEETLKWGEPSYVTKSGTTIRIDWKPQNPSQYALYVNCNSSIIPTIKMVYGEVFKYEKNRAIVFDLEEKLPLKELKKCVEVALTYHKIKHKPLLGL